MRNCQLFPAWYEPKELQRHLPVFQSLCQCRFDKNWNLRSEKMRFKSKKRSKPLVILCPILKSSNFQKDGSMAVSCCYSEVLIRRHLDLLGFAVECQPGPSCQLCCRGAEIWAVIFFRDRGSWTRVTQYHPVHKKSMVHVKAMEVKGPETWSIN